MIKIVTDSIANITQEEMAKYGITVTNLNVLVDGVSYVDNDAYVAKETFYNVLSQVKELPKTSQPSIGAFLEVYDSFEEGTEIISIHVTSSLSGTVNAARQAADMSKNNVTVIDSQFADRGQAFQVIEAAKLAQAGASKADILAKIEEVRQKTTLYISVFTLENLVKGGRVGKAQGLLSSLLNIKVILGLEDGVLKPAAKGRGTKSIQQFLDTTVYPDVFEGTVKECAISYVNETDFVNEQTALLQSKLPQEVLHFGYTISTVSIHAGLGAFAITYYKD